MSPLGEIASPSQPSATGTLPVTRPDEVSITLTEGGLYPPLSTSRYLPSGVSAVDMGSVSSATWRPTGSRRQPLLSRKAPPGSGPTCRPGAGRQARRGHGERVKRHWAAHRVQTPAAIEQEGAAGQRSHLFARRRLGAQHGDEGEEGDGQGDAIFQRTRKESHGHLSLYGKRSGTWPSGTMVRRPFLANTASPEAAPAPE